MNKPERTLPQGRSSEDDGQGGLPGPAVEDVWPWDEACCGVMASSLGDGIAVLDRDCNAVKVNGAFAALLGGGSSPLPRPVLGMFPEAARPALRGLLDACLRGEPARGEISFPHSSGSGSSLLLVSLSPLPFHPGRPSAMAMLVVDVTHVVAAKEDRNTRVLAALTASEHTSRALLNATLDAVLLVDGDGLILDINEHGAHRMGAANAAAVIGRTLAEVMPDEAASARLEQVREVFAKRRPARFEDVRNGMVLDNNLLPVCDGQGVVERVAVFERDITQHRENLASLRRQAFQQGVVAELGLFALSCQSLDELMHKTCRLAATLFSVELSTMMVHTPEGDLLLKAGVGWKPGLVGNVRVGVDGSHSGRAFTSNAPVVMYDIDSEDRFNPSQVMREHGVKSGMSVAVLGAVQPFGTLGVHSRSLRQFSEDEVHTLQAVANVLSEAVARLQAETSLEALGERNAAILRSVEHGIFGLDADCHITFANPAVERLTGYSAGELLGVDAHWLLHHTRPDGSVYPAEACPLNHTLKDGQHRHISEEVFWRKDGSNFPVDYSITPLFSGDKLVGAVSVFEDITERVRAQERLKRLAFFDELTGLANRTQFKHRLDSALLRGGKARGFAVLFLDVDDFKVINDGLGHTLGDTLLVLVSERLRKAVGPGCLLARMGGDEFAVLLEGDAASKEAVWKVEAILDSLAQPVAVQGYELFVSVCIGVVLGESEYRSSEEVLRDADTAMFKAKAQGKGESAVFDKAMHDAVRSRLIMENDLRRALERGELFVVYQPLVSLADRSLCGFEALMRWQHPERGLVGPMEFIPVAEASGLIMPLGEWILREACSQLARWRQEIPGAEHLSVSVNLSGRQFMQADLPLRVLGALTASGLPASALKLEITESVVMENAERAVEMLRELKRLGLHLMIDDFGTGYSSLAYLRRFPVDALKVDRSFVRNLDADRDNLQIVKAVVQMAASLEMAVVAEGIENERELEALLRLGCDMGQGYHFARPLGAGAAETHLKAALSPLRA